MSVTEKGFMSSSQSFITMADKKSQKVESNLRQNMKTNDQSLVFNHIGSNNQQLRKSSIVASNGLVLNKRLNKLREVKCCRQIYSFSSNHLIFRI